MGYRFTGRPRAMKPLEKNPTVAKGGLKTGSVKTARTQWKTKTTGNDKVSLFAKKLTS